MPSERRTMTLPSGSREFSGAARARIHATTPRPGLAWANRFRLPPIRGRARWWLLVILALAAVAIGWWASTRHDPTRVTRPFRIGFQESPPQQIVTADQK